MKLLKLKPGLEATIVEEATILQVVTNPLETGTNASARPDLRNVRPVVWRCMKNETCSRVRNLDVGAPSIFGSAKFPSWTGQTVRTCSTRR